MKKLFFEKKNEAGYPVIVLQGELVINDIIAYKNVILDKFKSESSFQIDLSEINKIDTAGLQLLLATRHKGKEDDINVALVNPSMEVGRIFSLYGLECI